MAHRIGVHVGGAWCSESREIASTVTPDITPERCLTSGVFDPCEVGKTMILQGTLPWSFGCPRLRSIRS